jgi:UPF0755 protein
MTAFHINKQHKKRGIWFWLLVVLTISIVTSLSAFFFAKNWYDSNLKPLNTNAEAVRISVPVGATASEIGTILEDQSVIRSAYAFDWYARLNSYRDSLQAGEYKFSPAESVQEIVMRLVEGDIATDLVTILPAQRLDQIRANFIKLGFDSMEVDKALNADLYRDHPALSDLPESASLEGYLYPESFQRTSTTTLQEVITASLNEMANALTPDIRTKITKMGLTVHEGVILASIIEREVSDPEDKLIVAQVFLSRLRIGMMLGSDPTALYGALVAGIEPSVFADTPYNTRLYTGLPPGPINNVSASSLQALINPADTDYLYFVSGDDGNTYFSKTLAEHEALTAKHCVELCNSY